MIQQEPFQIGKKQIQRKINWSLAIFLTVICLCLASWPIFAQTEISEQRFTFNMSSRLGILVIAAVIAFLTRARLLKILTKLMMVESKSVEQPELAPLSSEEIATKQNLVITELSLNSQVDDATDHRAIFVERARSGLWRLFFIDLAVVAAYLVASITTPIGNYDVVLGYDAYVSIYGETSREYFDIEFNRFFGYHLYLVLLLFWNIMRIIGDRHQFKAYHRGFFGLIKPFWAFFFWFFQTRWCQVLAFIMMVNAFIPGFFALIAVDLEYALPLLAAVLFHGFLLYRLKASGRKRTNLRLLILRVFAINKTSYLTFSGLAKFWQHFGSYFTVADPSFYRVYWRRRFNFMFPIFMMGVLFFYTLLTDRESDLESVESVFTGFVALMLIMAIVFILYSQRKMKRGFITGEEHLRKDLNNLNHWPTKFNNTFKDFPVMCFDNTWKIAVAEFARTAEVILMDLRGFSEANKGCEFEINYLFDHVPAERIVFLASADSVPLIKETIGEQWRLLHGSSPNLKTHNPQTKLYIVGKENNQEIQRILDILLETAATEAASK